MYLETERLLIYPMTKEQLKTASNNFSGAAGFFGARPGRAGLVDILRKRKIYGIKHDIICEHPDAWLITTMWVLVDKKTREMVGEAGFKGPPYDGEIEIGYGTMKAFRGRGYMTEAVGALIQFAFAQSEVTFDKIVATTLPKNTSSHRVLEKNGFDRHGMRGEFWLWIRNRNGETEAKG